MGLYYEARWVGGVFFGRVLRKPLLNIGYAIGMTGSVLWDGTSNKDLDLIIYHLSAHYGEAGHRSCPQPVENCGLCLGLSREEIAKIWRKKGSLDNKHVEYWDYQGRRVDIFYLS